MKGGLCGMHACVPTRVALYTVQGLRVPTCSRHLLLTGTWRLWLHACRYPIASGPADLSQQQSVLQGEASRLAPLKEVRCLGETGLRGCCTAGSLTHKQPLLPAVASKASCFGEPGFSHEGQLSHES